MASLSTSSGIASSSSLAPLYVLKSTEEGGQSLYSSTEATIPRGTLLFQDSPLFTIPQDARSVEDVQGRVRKLGKDQQRAFLSLSNCRSGDKGVSPVMGVFKTNVLPAGPGESAIFPLASRLNHSCLPNCEHTFHPSIQTIQIRTLSDIPPNTELTLSYLSTRLLLPSFERRVHLLKSFNFLCNCPPCSMVPTNVFLDEIKPEEEGLSRPSQQSTSDQNRSEIASLKEAVDTLFPTSPALAYSQSLDLLDLCEEEGLVVEGAFARATLAMILIMWGGEVELGEEWVESAWREFVVARGEEGEDAKRWGRWRGRVGEHPRRGCLGSWEFGKKEGGAGS